MDCYACAEATWDGIPDPRPAMRDTGRSAAATALTGLLACLHQLRDRRLDGRQPLWRCPVCWPRTYHRARASRQ